MSRSLKWLITLAVAATSLSACERLEERGARRPSLNFDPTMETVPLAYGRLVAVSPAGQNPASVALWFEGDDQALTAVRVNASTGAISKEVIVVLRN